MARRRARDGLRSLAELGVVRLDIETVDTQKPI